MHGTMNVKKLQTPLRSVVHQIHAKLLQNIGTCLQVYTAKHSRRLEFVSKVVTASNLALNEKRIGPSYSTCTLS